MSGGSYDYAYRHLHDFASQIRDKKTNPLRAAFAAHCELVADAMKAVEWVDSGDYGKSDEDEAIRKCMAPGAELDAAVKLAEQADASLRAAIAFAKDRLGSPPISDETERTDG